VDVAYLLHKGVWWLKQVGWDQLGTACGRMHHIHHTILGIILSRLLLRPLAGAKYCNQFVRHASRVHNVHNLH